MTKPPEIHNLSAIQEEIRQTARNFAEKEIVPISRNLDRQKPCFPREIYQEMALSGFLGFTDPKNEYCKKCFRIGGSI